MAAGGEHNEGGQFQVDLHGCSRPEAERLLARELHACRVRGARRLTVITGRGYGNRAQEPVLRDHVEGWLRGPTARGLGVTGFERVHRGGALEVHLTWPGSSSQ
jgi:DNA-nicking Smr family endonuclease